MKENKNMPKISKENRFHVYRTEIRKIGARDGVDVSTAARMWAYGMGQSDFTAELMEFEAYVAALQKETTPENNLVLKYFEGGEIK